jgi:alkyldihydroxyacetonephosphate synthase
MQRWNGWGDEKINYPVPGNAKGYLAEILGGEQHLPDASLDSVINKIPGSQFKKIDFISTDPVDRIVHSCGQSLPDWINLRSGHIPRFTDGVVYPNSEGEIKKAIDFAVENDFTLIPYGGGTSVVGHINPPPTETPAITLDLACLNRMLDIDRSSQLATFEAGIKGPDLESALNQVGYTLGHFPQSFEYSTLGGWIATRSCGQQSYHYGRIEDLFRGGKFITPLGDIGLPPFPASAAGPDLKQIILGSEGRLGIISQAIVQIQPLPQYEEFYGIFFRDWEEGMNAVKEIAQSGIQLSMLRLSDPRETETTLILSGKENLLPYANFGLSKLGYGEQRCLLIMGVTGDKSSASQARSAAIRVCRKFRGLYTGNYVGKSWRKSRFLAPYLRNTLWEAGYALDTLETAVPWDKVNQLKNSIIKSITQASENDNQRVLVFGHISHVYHTGASIYITYLFRRSADPQETLERWQGMKDAASKTIVGQGGTISHQHGIGQDHAEYLSTEIGNLGVQLLRNISNFFDPQAVLNPQKPFNSTQFKR